MKLLLIFTGGTIGSSVKDNYISVSYDNIKLLLENSGFSDNESNSIKLDIINPYTILSETLNGTHIASLVECINKQANDYDGIIVTHGTDTLQYTAAALGYCFANSKTPIVLVSSNYILEDPRANGKDNFSCAMQFLKTAYANRLAGKASPNGVFVAYTNTGEESVIHYATRLLPHLSFSDDVRSIENDIYEYSYPSNAATNIAANATISNDFSNDITNLMNHSALTMAKHSDILVINSYPGATWSAPADNIRFVILNAYHSGTINTKDTELISFAQDLKSKRIPLFLTGLDTSGITYESTKTYGKLGIRILPKASPIALYMKLWILSSNQSLTNDMIINFMSQEIAEDIV